jgi:hypothetical protein
VRELNLAIEKYAYKAFKVEIYPAYDLRKVAEGFREKARADLDAAQKK